MFYHRRIDPTQVPPRHDPEMDHLLYLARHKPARELGIRTLPQVRLYRVEQKAKADQLDLFYPLDPPQWQRGDPLKVALCFSGFMRNYPIFFSSRIFQQLVQKYQPDIYISAWDLIGYGSCADHKLDYDLKLDVDHLKETCPNLVELEVETYKEMESKLKSSHSDAILLSSEPGTLGHFRCQFYKVWKCMEMVNRSRKAYHLIVRLRPDIILGIIPDLERIMENPNVAHSLYLTIDPLGRLDVTGDQMAIGTAPMSTLYADLYHELSLPRFLRKPIRRTCEKVLESHLRSYQIRLVRQDWDLQLNRTRLNGYQYISLYMSPDGVGFDWEFYVSHYPDLRHITDPLQAWDHWIRLGINERRICHPGPKIFKLFLMNKDLDYLLEDWIVHHGTIFGFHNLHIIDNSGPETQKIFNRYLPHGIQVHTTNCGLNDLDKYITKLMKSQVKKCDYLIKMDTDEFLMYTLDEGKTLKCDPEGFQDFIDQLPRDGRKYKAWYTCDSRVIKATCDYPMREMTTFTPLMETPNKTFFAHTLDYCDLGSHKGRTIDLYDHLEPFKVGLVWVHFNRTSYEHYVQKAKEAIVSHNYIQPSDGPQTQKQKLQGLLNCQHLPSSHKVKIYLDHLNGKTRPETFIDDPRGNYRTIDLTEGHHSFQLIALGRVYLQSHSGLYLTVTEDLKVEWTAQPADKGRSSYFRLVRAPQLDLHQLTLMSETTGKAVTYDLKAQSEVQVPWYLIPTKNRYKYIFQTPENQFPLGFDPIHLVMVEQEEVVP